MYEHDDALRRLARLVGHREGSKTFPPAGVDRRHRLRLRSTGHGESQLKSNGDRMIPAFTRKATGEGINHYRYYMPSADKKFGRGTNPVGAIPAEAIESLVVDQVLAALQSPRTVQSVWDEVKRRAPSI